MTAPDAATTEGPEPGAGQTSTKNALIRDGPASACRLAFPSRCSRAIIGDRRGVRRSVVLLEQDSEGCNFVVS